MDKFVLLDLETTGVEPRLDDIIEVGLVLVENGQEVLRIDKVVKSDKPLSPFVIELTGITPDAVSKGVELPDILAELQPLVENVPIVGHNIEFDVNFLKAKGLTIQGPLLDTWEMSTALLPHLASYSLEYISWYYDFENQPAHRAIKDVLANLDLLRLLAHKVTILPKAVNTALLEAAAESDFAWRDFWRVAASLSQDYPPRETARRASKLLDNGALKPDSLTDKISFVVLPPQVSGLDYALDLAERTDRPLVFLPFNYLRTVEREPAMVKLSVSGRVDFDEDNFDRFRQQKEFTTAEVILLLKVLVWLEHKKTDPQAPLPYLTRDQAYLWQRRLSPFRNTRMEIRPLITSFTAWKEASQDKAVGEDTAIIVDPERFLAEMLAGQGFRWNHPVLEGMISSRRDFVKTLQENGLFVDKLFKILSKAGERFVALSGELDTVFVAFHQTNPRGYADPVTLGGWLWDSHEGKGLRKNLEEIKTLWEEFLSELDQLEAGDEWLREYGDFQKSRIANFLAEVELMLSMPGKYLFSLESYNARFNLKVVPTSVNFEDINTIKAFKKVVFVSNGLSPQIEKVFQQTLGFSGTKIEVETPQYEISLKTGEVSPSVSKVFNEGEGTLVLVSTKKKVLEMWELFTTKAPDLGVTTSDFAGTDHRLAGVLDQGRRVVMTYRDLENVPLIDMPGLKRVIMAGLPYEMGLKQDYSALQVSDSKEFEELALPIMSANVNRAVARLLQLNPEVQIEVWDPKLKGYLDKVCKCLVPYITIRDK